MANGYKNGNIMVLFGGKHICLATILAQSEDTVSYSELLSALGKVLKDQGAGDLNSADCVIFKDRAESGAAAMRQELPEALTQNCGFHMQQNLVDFHKKNGCDGNVEDLKARYWAVQKATDQLELETAEGKFKEAFPKAYEYFQSMGTPEETIPLKRVTGTPGKDLQNLHSSNGVESMHSRMGEARATGGAMLFTNQGAMTLSDLAALKLHEQSRVGLLTHRASQLQAKEAEYRKVKGLGAVSFSSPMLSDIILCKDGDCTFTVRCSSPVSCSCFFWQNCRVPCVHITNAAGTYNIDLSILVLLSSHPSHLRQRVLDVLSVAEQKIFPSPSISQLPMPPYNIGLAVISKKTKRKKSRGETARKKRKKKSRVLSFSLHRKIISFFCSCSIF